MILSARTLKADEALAVGLVDHVVPADQLLTQALALAERIAAHAPVAVRMAKAAINRGADLTMTEGLQLERDLATFVYTTQDAKEGPLAFVEKRPPNWQDR
jgi:enoyl-CoA hydratase/carnithine racemase